MKNIKIYMLLAATMLMVAACGSDDDDLGGTSGSSIWLSYIKIVRDIRHSHFGLSMRMLTAARMTSRNMSFPSTNWKNLRA